MGYMTCMSPCVLCGKVFNYNPDLVPSLRIDGTRQPVCEPCVTKANAERKEKGLNLFTVLPGAYEGEEVG